MSEMEPGICVDGNTLALMTPTPQGVVCTDEGDWVIKSDGGVAFCDTLMFEATYERY